MVSLWLISVKPSRFFVIWGDWPELDLEAGAYTGSAAAQSKEQAEQPEQAKRMFAAIRRRDATRAKQGRCEYEPSRSVLVHLP